MSVWSPFEKFPEFNTDRLHLRMVKESDIPALFEMKSDPDTTSRYGAKPHLDQTQTAEWVRILFEDYKERTTLFWCITLNESDTPIGSFTLWNMDLNSFRAELGYELNSRYWRKGIMGEALDVLLDWAFSEMGLNRIEACPLRENTSSVRMLEKLGFELEGNLKERIFFDGEFKDQLYFGMTRSSWERTHGNRQNSGLTGRHTERD